MPKSVSQSHELRQTIDRLPLRTRIAMLDGVRSNRIVAGAYVGAGGDGVCPMLAAHRCGGRTDFISFARAWDAFTGVRRARRATIREVGTLIEQLRGSIAAEEHTELMLEDVDLGAAIAEHRELARASSAAAAAELTLADAIDEHRDLQLARAVREEHDEDVAPGAWPVWPEPAVEAAPAPAPAPAPPASPRARPALLHA